MFCGEGFTKLARHLERKHSNEMEVAKALSHPKGSKERRRQNQQEENTFLFAQPLAMTCFQGSDCIRDFAKPCSGKNPKTLTSINLWKQIETLS